MRSELLQRISALLNAWEVPRIFTAIFGSAARGEMRPDSDIDLLVVRSDEADAEDERWGDQLAYLSERVTAWTGNDTRVLELSAAKARGRSPYRDGGVEPDMAETRWRSSSIRFGRLAKARRVRKKRLTGWPRSPSSQFGDHCDAGGVTEDGIVRHARHFEPTGGRRDPAVGLVMLLAERVSPRLCTRGEVTRRSR